MPILIFAFAMTALMLAATARATIAEARTGRREI